MKLQRMWMLLIGLLLIATTPASACKWTSSNGKFSVEADLVEVKDGNVRLKLKDGKIKTVPVSKLSKVDRDFLASKAKVNPGTTRPTSEEVIAAIKKLRGSATVNKNKKVVYVYLGKTKVTDAGLEQLKGLTNLRQLDLHDTTVTDAGLKHLKGLTNLQKLVLFNTQVTDRGLEHLKGLTKLQSLILNNTEVTDAGLEQLKGLTKLQTLYLGDTKVADAGLEHLKGLTNLHGLDFGNTKVSDAGLVHLKGLAKLRYLRLTGTKVTDEGVKKLQQALPNCEIIR